MKNTFVVISSLLTISVPAFAAPADSVANTGDVYITSDTDQLGAGDIHLVRDNTAYAKPNTELVVNNNGVTINSGLAISGKLSGLQNGVNATDAVNFSQLQQATSGFSNRIDSLENSVKSLENTVSSNRREYRSGIASSGASAAAMMNAIKVDGVGIGASTFSGQGAAAVALGKTFNNGNSASLAVGYSGSKALASAGVGIPLKW
ncbi:YadA-like family protein [Laribacter hongkongensis]|uniref:YadA-like family protein n=1 Tax=Laribacter hongkongensis TaxID=168471 RepID=UPI001EFDB826|nr:hypothetical protein [Laribacter hongkongensis]MCG9095322.1 hypothetical protein [Laribacter hongkongensis]